MSKVYVVAGPTASGKTAYAIELAKKLNGEVVSADSMQVYKYMDIGTAKPTVEETEEIAHYMIDVISPLEEFNVVKYQAMARECIDDILRRGKVPIVCGGTGLYINSLLYNISYSETKSDSEFREQMMREYEEHGAEFLYDKLKNVDPDACENIHPNNVKRVIRALEVYENTGKLFSECVKESLGIPTPYEFECYFLNPERAVLYERINLRVDKMIERGLIEETEYLYKNGLLEGPTASMGICYKELLPYVLGDKSLVECTDKLKQATRNYAKRQITWFKRNREMQEIS